MASTYYVDSFLRVIDRRIPKQDGEEITLTLRPEERIVIRRVSETKYTLRFMKLTRPNQYEEKSRREAASKREMIAILIGFKNNSRPFFEG